MQNVQINFPPPKMSITANDKLQQVPRTGKYICYSKLNFHINWSRNKINLILVCPKKIILTAMCVGNSSTKCVSSPQKPYSQ